MNNDKNYYITETKKELYGELYTAYGIKGENCSFEDISTDKETVIALAELLNREEVEECHFTDIIADTLDR